MEVVMKYSYKGTNFASLCADIRLVTLAIKPKTSVEPSEVLAREVKALERVIGDLVSKLER